MKSEQTAIKLPWKKEKDRGSCLFFFPLASELFCPQITEFKHKKKVLNFSYIHIQQWNWGLFPPAALKTCLEQIYNDSQ